MTELPTNNLPALVDAVATPYYGAAVSVAVHKIADEIARETLNDPEFRESLRALVKERSRAILANLLHMPEPQR